jgi:serine/threonine-protein kinase
VLDQVCGSLAEAHATGLIHRDVKPANVILCERGGVPDVAKVVDFGLARPLDEAEVRLTASTALTGTPLYMPPESISDPERVDERSDLYSLGAVAYYLLAGEDVFKGRNAVEVCGHHLHSEPEPLAVRTGGRVPPVLDGIVLACLAKRPEGRPRSALDLRERLRDSGVRPWGDWEAREWWDEHAEELRKRRAATAPSDLTLAVDLEARGTPLTDSAAVTRER